VYVCIFVHIYISVRFFNIDCAAQRADALQLCTCLLEVLVAACCSLCKSIADFPVIQKRKKSTSELLLLEEMTFKT